MIDTFYNDNDPKIIAWLKELLSTGEISSGKVEKAEIQSLSTEYVRRFRRCHFFAGIGGWDVALRLAGWPADRPVWTGSCPCQPFSSAGKRKAHADERHLWPEFFRLIRECRPPVIFGEQVASAEVVGTELEAAFVVAVQRGEHAKANRIAKRLVRSRGFHFHPRWIDGVRSDLEGIGYAFRFKILGAHSVGAPHIRQRVFWVAYTQRSIWGTNLCRGLHESDRERSERKEKERPSSRSSTNAYPVGLANTDDQGSQGWGRAELRQRPDEWVAGTSGNAGESEINLNAWSRSDLIACQDGKTRRAEPRVHPLADGISGRVGLLRGYGNAIVPQVAAVFIRSFMNYDFDFSLPSSSGDSN